MYYLKLLTDANIINQLFLIIYFNCFDNLTPINFSLKFCIWSFLVPQICLALINIVHTLITLLLTGEFNIILDYFWTYLYLYLEVVINFIILLDLFGDYFIIRLISVIIIGPVPLIIRLFHFYFTCGNFYVNLLYLVF